MAIQIDKEQVIARQAQLERARSELKQFFIGIDGVIDTLCDAVAVWYTMPEVISRPVIINLWGMTGVGKTDLVRRLVRHLDIQERFVEIELNNGDTTTWHSSVASRLEESGALQGHPTLLLFDEVQRFNTIDQDGKPLTSTKFSDFWELLSDGRLARRHDHDFDYLFADMIGSVRNRKRAIERGEDAGEDRIGMWEARSLKRAFGMQGALEDLSDMSYDEAMARMQSARTDKRIYEPIDCTKCLIIISGNLDEAFTMARETAEADVDADIFHAFTSKITMVDIKAALIRRFKPEQVARFGNIHIIYTSLRRVHFESLIHREVERVIRATRESFDITLTVGDAVRSLVYRNGVFPVQGVRPVFSSVADIVESNLAKLLFRAILDDERSIDIDYDDTTKQLIGTVGSSTVRLSYSGPIDKIRDATLPDKVANVAVHESGHAVVYGVLFGLAPLQLTSRVASTYVGGFTFPHQLYLTSASLLHQVQVLLAGGLAEEIVFGSEGASVGRNADREKATELLIDFVRRYGFDREFQANYMLEFNYQMDRSVPEPDIEKMMTRLVAETKQLLSEHRSMLVEMSVRLGSDGQLTAADVAALMARFGVRVEVKPEGYQWIPAYQQGLSTA
jgi:cell division protease FtsH